VVPIGKVYEVDLDSRTCATLCHYSGIVHQKEIVWTVDGPARWLPLECLELQLQ
jgi:hypothetical protein